MSMRRLSLRDRLYQCRARTSDEGLLRIEVLTGLCALLHPAGSAVLISLGAFPGAFLLPLIALCAEVCLGSCFMIFVIICDFCSHAKTFSVWQREAVGRLLRNFLMGLLAALSLLSVYTSLDARGKLTDRAWIVRLKGIVHD